MISNPKSTIFLLIALSLGFLGIFGLSRFIENKKPGMPEGYLDSDLAINSKLLPSFSLGLNGLIADWYWMQSLQYLGGKLDRNKEKKVDINDLREINPRLLYSYLDTATDFDPKFIEAYSFGIIVLPAIDKEQAIKIAEKGIANNPSEWKLYQHLAYVYWKNGDFEKASKTYEEGSKIEGAPSFMKVMSAKLINESGSREIARDIFSQMASEADDIYIKMTAERNLQKLDALDEIDAIQMELDKYKKESGNCPKRLSEIFPMLQKIRLPNNKDFRIDKAGNMIDPSGAAYKFDIETCKISLDTLNTKIF